MCAYGFRQEIEDDRFAARASRRQRARLNEILTKWRQFTAGAAERIGRMVLAEAGRTPRILSAGDAEYLIAFFGEGGAHRSRAEGVFFGR